MELHVPSEGGPLTAEVEGALRDLVVAYRVHRSDSASIPVDLPAIRDGERWISAADLPAYLDDLRTFVGQWRKFQADACYLEDDGSVC